MILLTDQIDLCGGNWYSGERRALVPVEMNWYDSVPKVTIASCDQIQ
jgi:hypothetical protein